MSTRRELLTPKSQICSLTFVPDKASSLRNNFSIVFLYKLNTYKSIHCWCSYSINFLFVSLWFPKTDQNISAVHVLVNQKTFSSVGFNLFYLREAWLQLCTMFFLYFSHRVVSFESKDKSMMSYGGWEFGD